MYSIISDKKTGMRPWAVLVWLAVWQIFSMIVGEEILLVSPVSAIMRFFALCASPAFWQAVAFSSLRIAIGFLSAAVLGVALAALAARFKRVRELLEPLMLLVKATPVASFIILTLILLPAENISAFMAFLMVLPILYTNVLVGIGHMDIKLLEMARVFRLPAGRRLRYMYAPMVLPFFRAACALSLSMSWKAGIAAEVIGIPEGSIGERFYTAKIYLNTPDLFAWTLTVILIGLVFEKLFLYALDGAFRRMEAA